MAGISKNILIFENSTLKFSYFKQFGRKRKSLDFEPKVPYLVMFFPEFYKNIVVFEINTLEFVNLEIFAEKPKCLNLRQRMPYLGIIMLKF